MKIYPEQTEKWLRMNKSAFWELFEGERKTPIYSYSDSEATIDSANDALNEVLNELANGEYKIRAKQSLKSPNNTYVTRDLVIGVSMIHTSEPTKTNGNMSEILKLHDERTQMLLDAKDREYQIRDFQNEVKKLNEKFDKLLKCVSDLEDNHDKRLDGLENGKGSNPMQDTVKSGVNSMINHGSRVMMDRFGNPKS